MAQDKGYPPLSRTVEVQIDVVDRANNPPVWDHVVYGPIYIRENLPVGAKVVSVKARSVCPDISVFAPCGSTKLHGTSDLFVHASSAILFSLSIYIYIYIYTVFILLCADGWRQHLIVDARRGRR